MVDENIIYYKGEELRALLFDEFRHIFDDAKTLWRATDNSSDDFNSSIMYTPITDLVVGPYNIHANLASANREINNALGVYSTLLRQINNMAIVPYQEHLLNNNPRCFLAMEVGGSGSEKHLLGDMYNASVLGKIGFVVGTMPEINRSYKRLYEYTNFAYTVGKTDQSFGNLGVVDGTELLKLLKNYNGH